MPQVVLEHLSKHYQIHEKEPGLVGSLNSFFRRRSRTLKAVDDLSFQIQAGEIVGFLGPNGAGKTTTLKMLSGLLHPTLGHVSVLGFKPSERRGDYLRSITLVMGQKQQLNWDLPAIESLIVNAAIYRVPEALFQQTLAEFCELLDLGPLLKIQVRKLSLGERMKCELAAALLHRPKVLFLDEPTIGLDVTMQARIRQFIAEYNQRHGATVVLTSHYMADVTALCKRVVVIDHGKLLYDGELKSLADKLSPHKRISVQFSRPVGSETLSRYGQIVTACPDWAKILVLRDDISSVAAQMLAELPIADVSIEDPPIEDVITDVFAEAGEGRAQVAQLFTGRFDRRKGGRPSRSDPSQGEYGKPWNDRRQGG